MSWMIIIWKTFCFYSANSVNTGSTKITYFLPSEFPETLSYIHYFSLGQLTVRIA